MEYLKKFLRGPGQTLMQLYGEHVYIAAPLAFIGGIIYDSLTITRIDRLSENLFILGHLLVLGAVIIVVGRWKIGDLDWELLDEYEWYIPIVVQFLLGGLFSTYAVFYFKSTSLSKVGIFFLFIVALLVANELLYDRLMNLKLLTLLYLFVWLSFCVWAVPVLIQKIGPRIFIGSVLISLIPVGIVVLSIYWNRMKQQWRALAIQGSLHAGLVVLIILLYFLNLIPPVPLSLRHGGIYHDVTKSDDVYKLKYVKPEWYEVWRDYENPVLWKPDHRIYCYASVFATTELRTAVRHQWQIYDYSEDKWITTDDLQYEIVGSRYGGYRGYTYKENIKPGYWRVNILTDSGRLLGRMSFQIKKIDKDKKLDFVTYKDR